MEGAVRETREEANADVEVISPFAQLDIPLIGQVRTVEETLIYFPLFVYFCWFSWRGFFTLIIPCLWQTYMIFLAKLKKPHFSPGPESSECQLFSLDDIPFNSLSFSSMVVTLSLVCFIYMTVLSFILCCLLIVSHCFSWPQYVEDIKAGKPKFHYGTINKRFFSS